jgi:hypothetical protein
MIWNVNVIFLIFKILLDIRIGQHRITFCKHTEINLITRK